MAVQISVLASFDTLRVPVNTAPFTENPHRTRCVALLCNALGFDGLDAVFAKKKTEVSEISFGAFLEFKP
jgi:hypothetical protein